MKQLGTWLRRTAATSAVMVLAITGVGATGAAAGTASVPTDAVMLSGEPDGGFGVQHNGRTREFPALGCKFIGWSNHSTAGTEITEGNCRQPVYVRVLMCAGSSCVTSDWRSAPRRVTFTPGKTIRVSFHKACNTCLVHRIQH